MSGEGPIDRWRPDWESGPCASSPRTARPGASYANHDSATLGGNMGKTCAWCGTVLQTISGPAIGTTRHALCQGCLQELQTGARRSRVLSLVLGIRANEGGDRSVLGPRVVASGRKYVLHCR